MIVGDKIATANLTCDNTPQIVEVIAIEKHEIKWSTASKLRFGNWYIANADIKVWTDTGGNDTYCAEGRVLKRDRGITWCPAWIESEVELLKVVAALRTDKYE